MMSRVKDSILEKKIEKGEDVGNEVPCFDSRRANYWVNQDSVRTAVHAVSVEYKDWEICTGNISYTRIYNTVIPIHLQLLKAGYRVLIYSGDVDMCVPYTGSEAWTNSLGLTVQQDWRSWVVNYQLAGFVKTYSSLPLTFATIKGSGHTVPEFKPAEALYFFTQFLNDLPF